MKTLMHLTRIAGRSVHPAIWMALAFVIVIGAGAVGLANWPILTLVALPALIGAGALYYRRLTAATERLETDLPFVRMKAAQQAKDARLERRRLKARRRQEAA
jgi:hypothetical protein